MIEGKVAVGDMVEVEWIDACRSDEPVAAEYAEKVKTISRHNYGRVYAITNNELKIHYGVSKKLLTGRDALEGCKAIPWEMIKRLRRCSPGDWVITQKGER